MVNSPVVHVWQAGSLFLVGPRHCVVAGPVANLVAQFGVAKFDQYLGSLWYLLATYEYRKLAPGTSLFFLFFGDWRFVRLLCERERLVGEKFDMATACCMSVIFCLGSRLTY